MSLTLVGSQLVHGNGVFPEPQTTHPANTQGNLLVLLAAWSGNPLSGIGLPSGAVADSAGNQWIYAGDSGQSVYQPFAGNSVRVGVWFCPNALPITNWLSFGPQGYTSAYQYQLAEFSGLPAGYWPVIDFAVLKNALSPAGSISVTAQARQADYCFAVAAANQNISATPAPTWNAGWTVLNTINVSDIFDTSGGVVGSFAYQTVGSAGAVTATATWTSPLANQYGIAEAVVGISQTSFLPAQPRPFYPKIVVEAALGANPGNPAQAVLATEWTDMSAFALGKAGQVAISASRGQQYELAQPESGQLAVAMNNQNGDFNPVNAGAQFYSAALNPNPCFQQTTAPWAPQNNAKVAVSPLFSMATGTGTKALNSLQLTPDGVTASPGINSPTFPINANNQYSAAFWILSPGGWASGAVANINFFDSLGGYITTVNGGTTVIPAGVWTQVTSLNKTPPTNAFFASFGPSLNGTPTATPFYLAEAILDQGPAILTGLVRQGTPVRVRCFWNGRNYPVGYGLVERWPQDWPDIPQWGWSTLVATDLVGAAASVNLPSAVQGEILADQPYLCLPFNEQYTTSSNTLNGTVKSQKSADGMVAGNSSTTNQRAGTYIDGGNALVVTGQSLSLLGDSGTGMGTSSLAALDTTSHNRGPGVQYGPDYNIPDISFGALQVTTWTDEFWFQTTAPGSAPGANVFVQLFQVIGKPSLANSGGSGNLGAGVWAVGGVCFPSGVTAYVQPWVQMFNQASPTLLSPQLGHGAGHYLSLTQEGGGIFLAADGTRRLTVLGSTTAATFPIGLVWGECSWSTGTVKSLGNYALAYGTVYGFALSQIRQYHHQTAGALGFSGDTLLQRIFRYLAWGQLALGLAGPDITDISLGPAYSTSGTALASAINGDVIGSGGRWGSTANGNLVVIGKIYQQDQPASAVFGDTPVGNMNPNPGFEYGTTGWSTANGATLATSPVSFSGSASGQVTPNGVTANPEILANSNMKMTVTAGTSYTFSGWMACQTGWATGAVLAIDWYNGASLLSTSTSQTAQLLANVGGVVQWTPVVLTATAPATANGAIAYFKALGTPAAGNVFLVDLAVMRPTLDQVPYVPNMALDHDNTYVKNTVQGTLVQGPNTVSLPPVRDQNSVNSYLLRGPLTQQVSGADSGYPFDWAWWNLNKYSQPSLRVRQIAVMPSARPSTFDSVLQTDIGDAAVTLRTPLGGQPYSVPVVTQRVQIDISPGQWQSQFQQSPYNVDGAVLQADAAGYDVLGNNVMGW